jgi:hypothetical protein
MTIDYCLLPERIFDGIEVMKHHGSLNWARCTKCGLIDPWPLGQLARSHFLIRGNETSSTLEFVADLQHRTHCSAAPSEPDPVIVPPTWSKTQHHRDIAAVWKRAATHLSEAENIAVIGYSLPPTDQFFRYLYALGTMSKTRLRNFIVFNPDTRPAIANRFKRLLGQATRGRYAYWGNDFQQAITNIPAALARP